MKTIIGIELRSGEFVGQDGNQHKYDLAVLKLATDENPHVIGNDIMPYKLSQKKLIEISDLQPSEYKQLIGKKVDFIIGFKNDGSPYVSDIKIS